MKKINSNFLYSAVYQIFIYLIPLVTTPYISKVLGPGNIGLYSYSYSIIYYFMLITMLGINNYGPRNIAKFSADRNMVSEEFWSIYYLQLAIGLCMITAYNFFVTVLFSGDSIIFRIQNIFLVSTVLDISWFFWGIEKFRITISRNVIIKLFSLIMIFVFVKGEDDLWKYTLIMSLGTLFSQVYLWLFVRKYIDFKTIKIKKILAHIKPCVLLFIPVISYSIYKVMDKTMLGAISGTVQLGYYENAEKVLSIPTSLVTALGTVTLPAMSKVIDRDNYLTKIYENFKLSFCFIAPMMVGIMAVSKDFSVLFFGEKFAKSGDILFLLAPTLLFDALSCVIRTCYLIPQNKEHIYIMATVSGAILNFFVNGLLIPEYGYFGACIGTIVAVFSMMVIQVLSVRKIVKISKVFRILMPFLGKAFIMLMIILAVGRLTRHHEMRVLLQIIFGALGYIIMNIRFFLYEFLDKDRYRT